MNERDTRIVEMQFENRQFERNIAKSQKSLEDFKKELEFEDTSRGVQRFADSLDAIDFSGIGDNLERLTDKFTGLGDAGEWVLSRIRASLESTALQLESFLQTFTSAQITVGQGKYDSLNKAVQAIIATGEYTEDQAYSVFNRVMQYTDQTSASFEDMVSQISAFTATGKGLWDSEKAMEGIFNMTSKAGKGAAEASRAMGIFSKAMGQGFMGLEQWQSLNLSAHIITKDFRQQILEAAAAVGDLTKKEGKYYYTKKQSEKKQTKSSKKKEKEEKTGPTLVEVKANNLESSLNQKWLSDKTIMAVAQKYYFEKLTGATASELETFAGVAYKSAQRAMTFADAMNAIRESISSGWMESFQIIFGKATDAMELFTNLCDRVIGGIEGIKESRNEILKNWSQAGGRDSLIEAVLGDYGKDVETGAFGLIDLFESVGNIISDAFWDMVKIFARGDEQLLWDEEGYKEAFLGLRLRDMSNNIRDFIKSVKNFFTEDVEVNGKVTTRMQMVRDTVQGISGALTLAIQLIGGVMYFIDRMRQKLEPSFLTIGNVFAELGKAIYGASDDVQKSEGIKGFFDRILKALDPTTEGINGVVESLGGLFINFLQWGRKSGVFAKIFDFIARGLELAAKVIEKVGLPFLTFFEDITEVFSDLIANGFNEESLKAAGPKIADAFGKLFTGLFDIEIDPDSFLGKLLAIISTVIGKAKDLAGKLLGGFNLFDYIRSGFGFQAAYNFLNVVIGWFKGTNLYSVFTAFLGVATVLKLVQLIHQGGKAVEAIRWFFDDVGGSLKQGLLGEYEWFSERFLNIAKAIGILVAALYVLSTIPVPDLIKGALALALVGGALWGFMKLMDKFKGKQLDQLAITGMITALSIAIVGVSVGLGILMLAMAPLSNDPKKMITAILGFAAIMAILGGFLYLAVKSMMQFAKDINMGFSIGSSKNLLGIGGLLIALGAAIALIAVGMSSLMLALTPFAATGWGGMFRAAIGFGIIMAAMGVFIVVMTKQMVSLGRIVSGKGSTLSGMSRIALIMGTLAASVAAISFSIGLLVTALLPLAVVSWDGFARMMGGLVIVLLALSGMIKMLQKLGTGDKSISLKIAGLAGFAASLGILMFSLLPLAVMSWEGFARAMGGLIIVLGALLGTIKLLQVLGKDDKSLSVKVVGLAGFAASLGILIFALSPLAMMSWEGFARAMVGLIVVLGALLGTIKLIQLMSKSGDITTKIAGLAGLAASIGLLVYALLPLANVDTTGLIKMGVSLVTIFGLILGFVALMKVIKPGAMPTLALLAMAAVVVAVALALNEVKNINWSVIQSFMNGLALMVVAFAGAIAILSTVPIVAGLKAIALIGVALAAIIGVLALVVPMLIGSIGNSLVDFGAKLTLMANTVGDFATKMGAIDQNGLANGEGILNRLKKMVESLSGFDKLAGTVSSFTTSMYDIGSTLDIFYGHVANLPAPESMNAFKIVDKLLTYKNAFTDFTIGNIPTEIFMLGVGLYAFDSISDDITDVDDSKALKMLQNLAGCANDLKTLQGLGLEKLKGVLAGLGGAMSLYAMGAKEMTGLEPGETPDVDGAIAILKAITQSLTDEEGEGGFAIPDIPKESEIGSFGADLAALAGAVKQFVEASQGFGTGTQIAIDLLDFLSGDLKQRLTSENLSTANAFNNANVSFWTLSGFALNIIALGKALSDFVKSTSGMKEGEIKTAKDALTFFADLRTQLVADNFGTAIKSFENQSVGESELTAFGKNIEQLGGALATFASKVNWDESKEKRFQGALDALDFLVNLQTKLPTVGGVLSWLTGYNQTFTELSGQIETLGGAMADLTNKLIGEDGKKPMIDVPTINQTTTVLDRIVTFMNTLKTRMPTVGGLGNALSELFHGRDYGLGDLRRDLGELGQGIGAFSSGLGEGFDATKTATAVDIVRSIVDVLAALSKLGTDGNFDYWAIDQYMYGLHAFIYEMSNKELMNPENGENFPTMAQAIVDFMRLISGAMDAYGDIKPENINMFGVIAQSLKNLAEIDPNFNFSDVGANIATSLITGFTENTVKVEQAARDLIQAAHNAAIDQATQSGFLTALAIVSQQLAEGMEENPTITPVLDLTDVANGLTFLHQMMNENGTVTLNTTGAGQYAANSLPGGGIVFQQAPPDYSGIYERIETVTTKVEELGTKISKMQLVLDTGVVAGAVTEQIDMNLGREQFYTERGN